MNDWQYRFEFDDDRHVTVDAHWDSEEGIVHATPGSDSLPRSEWSSVLLENDQCPHCPLNPRDSPLCPLAASVIPVTRQFDEYQSSDPVRVIARSRDREVRADITLQRGLGSLLGLLMGGSACPHFALFRPMAMMHLPFASEEETFFRVIGNVLLSQALKDGRTSLAGASEQLRQQYDALSTVNRGMALRLRRYARSDPGINAVIVLDMLARLIGDDPDEYIDALRPLYPE